MPHRGEAHAAALPRIARASLPCRACLAAVSPPQPAATLRTLPCRRHHARHTTAARTTCASPPHRRVALLRCPAVLSYRSALPRRSTVARRTLRTATARHSHHRSAPPSRRAVPPLCRSALPSRCATPSRRPAAALCAFSHGSLFCRPSRRPVTPFHHPVRHPGAPMQHRHAASPLAAPTVRKSPKLFNIVPYLKPEAH